MNNYKKQKILIFDVNIISVTEFLNQVKKFLSLKKAHYICVSNVHQCIEAHDNTEFAKVINNSDLAIPDGRPIYWALKLLGHKDAKHITGHKATRVPCKFAAENKIGLTPKWIQSIGMSWLTRLIAEPRRLFWRYAYTNSKFLYFFNAVH